MGYMFRWLNPVARTQRAYVASHPLGVWLSIGIAASGYINLLFPHLSGESSSSIVFSPLVLLMFNLSWAVGGTMSLVGLLRGRRKLEGGGMSILSAGMLSLFLAIFALRPQSALTALFVLALGIGCGVRAWHLAHHAYVNLDVPIDQPGGWDK